MRDDVYRAFNNANNVLRQIRNNLFNSVQKFPYHVLSNTGARDFFTVNVTNFLDNCMKPTLDYLEINSVLPIFNFSSDSTTPVEGAFKPVSDSISQIYTALDVLTRACIRLSQLMRVGDPYIRPTYENFLNKIRACISTTQTAYRSPLATFLRTQNSLVNTLNRVVATVQACAITLGDRNLCVINLSFDFCTNESPTECEICGKL